MNWQTVAAVAATLGSLGGVLVLVRGVPWLIALIVDRTTLLTKIELTERERDDLKKSLEAAGTANEGWQAAFNSLGSQITAARTEMARISRKLDETTAELRSLKQRWAVGVDYIAQIIEHHEQFGNKHPLPPLPVEIREDVNAAIDAREQAEPREVKP